MNVANKYITRRGFLKDAAGIGMLSALSSFPMRAIAQENFDSESADQPWRKAYLGVCESIIAQYGEPRWEQTAVDNYVIAGGLAFAILVPMGGAASLQLVVAYRPDGTPAEQIDQAMLWSSVYSEYRVEVWDYDQGSNQAVGAWAGNIATFSNGGWYAVELSYGPDGKAYLLTGIDGESNADKSYYSFVDGICTLVHELAWARSFEAPLDPPVYTVDGIEVDYDTYQAQLSSVECVRQDWVIGRNDIAGDTSLLAPLAAQQTLAFLRGQLTQDPLVQLQDEWSAAVESGWQILPAESSLAYPAITAFAQLMSGESRPRQGWEMFAAWRAWDVRILLGTDAADALVVGLGSEGSAPIIVGIYYYDNGILNDITNGCAVNSYHDSWSVISGANGQLIACNSLNGSSGVTYDLVGGVVVPAQFADSAVMPLALEWQQLGEATAS